jgi:hypothetical protein
LLVYDYGNPVSKLFAVDAVSGARTVLHSLPDVNYNSLEEMTLDPSSGRLIAGVRSDSNVPFVLTGIDVATGALVPISGAALGTGPDLGYITGIGIYAPPGEARRYVVASINPFTLLAVDPANGNRTALSSGGPTNIGTGPSPNSVYDLDIDSTARRALVISDQGTLVWVDLVTGNRSLVMGTGPRILDYGPKVRADFAAGVAYVAASQTLYAVDLATGQRAIVSR